MNNDRVSVVITTKNAMRTIRACLESVRSQTYHDAEIIVVDNASADGTTEIAHGIADKVLVAGPERSAQRNAGIRSATGRYVLILDCDMVLEPSVISSCIEAYAESGRPVAIPEVSFGTGFWSECKALERSAYANDQTVSAARFYERDAVLALGGYDESLTGPEDWDMSMRAARGADIAIARTRIFHDEGRQSLTNLYRKKQYYGASIAKFIAKHGRAGLLKVNPVRGSLIANLGRFLQRPHLAMGLLCMKAVELAGLLHGMLLSKSRQPGQLYTAFPTNIEGQR